MQRPGLVLAAKGRPEPGLPSTPGIEIPSPSDTFREVQERIEAWLTAGAKSVWLVDPDRRRVKVYAHPHRPQVFEAGDALTDRAIPGFSVRVAELFAEG
ncbi:Uma2 family endonuclease [Carboxydochorda subterranea]|uniref:Uma2 family endonuclease n=1 Tax=Carboxydichorda subterranea TaxID=3109565 RepID=A0ABZ1C175_9FIRM|nr:Uma2 family endonuclease [Limnochorda sp. L945t]WRP18851.1 Uma2 family endonuclease [Limnochorda sp. L945t]